MPTRFTTIAREYWQYLGPAFAALSKDLETVESGGAASTDALKSVQWTSTDPTVRPAAAPTTAPVVFYTVAQPTAMLDGDVWIKVS